MKKSTGGKANKFQRDFLEANLKGANYHGSKVIAVTNKYIVTENERIDKRGADVSFTVKDETREMLRFRPDHDTEASTL